MYIDLTMGPRLTAYSDEVATQRQNLAEKLGRKPHSDAPTDRETALAMNVLGARCEGLAWSWLKPLKWSTAMMVDPRGLPDLEVGMLKIDVKGVEQHRHSLIVLRDDPADWAYLLVSAEEQPRYRVFGWLWGHEAQAWPVRQLGAGRPPVHAISDKAKLRSPAELHQRVETERAGSFLCAVCGGYATRTVDNGKTWLCREHDLAKQVEQREE